MTAFDDIEIALAEIADDDLLLDALGAGTSPQSDAVARTLRRWRAELDGIAVEQAGTGPAAVREDAARRRLVRAVVTGTTALVVVGGGSVAAAAIGGPHGPLGPLHRVLFGHAPAAVPARDRPAPAARAPATGGATSLLQPRATHVLTAHHAPAPPVPAAGTAEPAATGDTQGEPARVTSRPPDDGSPARPTTASPQPAPTTPGGEDDTPPTATLTPTPTVVPTPSPTSSDGSGDQGGGDQSGTQGGDSSGDQGDQSYRSGATGDLGNQ